MRALHSCLQSIRAFVYCMSALFLLVSLATYHAGDSVFLYATSHAAPIANWCGWCGAQVSAGILYLFASAGYLLVPALFLLGMRSFYSSHTAFGKDRIATILIFIPLSSILLYTLQLEWYAHVRPGGICGQLLTNGLGYIVDQALLPWIIFFVFWSMFIMLVGFAWVVPCVQIMRRVCSALRIPVGMQYASETLLAIYFVAAKQVRIFCTTLQAYVWPQSPAVEQELEAVVYDKNFWEQRGAETTVVQSAVVSTAPEISSELAQNAPETVDSVQAHEAAPVQAREYKKPDVSGLKQKPLENSKADRQEQQQQAQVLEEKLKRFGIKGSVLNITAGPVVTIFEYQPQIDVPISRIIAREDDLALALQAVSLRIIAPIPGRSVVGFEVSNVKRKTVFFSESVNSSAFTQSDAQLPLIIGQTTIGEQAIIDLTKMPHLLVAGSTGSGKSVALNAMLLSILCKATPDEVRMILIDPKRLEFAAYADIPHLLFPIVTDPKIALQVLQWAVTLMENRYEQMAAAGVRNIYDYRSQVTRLRLSGPSGSASYDGQAKDDMPYIVIVIDELADLMMVAGKDVENSIARLAQMARAAGIHLILATQRPSVDVITGVVKVNFPARLACKVTSKIDSRTILDVGGAEKLLGKGDMLFLDTQGRITRLHGAYVTDQEIATIVTQVKAQRAVVYEQLPTVDKDCTVQGEDAALYKELVEFVKSVDEVSISLLQRRFRIGYNRSARLMDLLESQGIIMPSSGSKTRKVLH